MAEVKHSSVMSLFWGALAVSAGALVISVFTDPRNPIRQAKRPARPSTGRNVSGEPIDDKDLNNMPTEEEARAAAQTVGGGGGGGGYQTCSYGWTFVCDSHPPGQTCKSGYTFKCDTGTCTSGWTLWCDNRPW
jgi:hypothetical protein